MHNFPSVSQVSAGRPTRAPAGLGLTMGETERPRLGWAGGRGCTSRQGELS